MDRSTKTTLLRDANNNIIPQHYDDKIGKYVAIGIGDLSDVNFRKTTLLRDGNNRIIPNQYYDANIGQWSVATSQLVGKSAYDIAVEHGFVGSQAEWLDSLRGEGVSLSGKSAYELALATGYIGTIDEWLASLVGADGSDGVNIRVTTDTQTVFQTDEGAYLPASIIVYAAKRIGGEQSVPYALTYVVKYYVVGFGDIRTYQTFDNVTNAIIPVPMLDASRNIQSVVIEAYDNGLLIDTIRIPVVRNGPQGDKGDVGRAYMLTQKQRKYTLQ